MFNKSSFLRSGTSKTAASSFLQEEPPSALPPVAAEKPLEQEFSFEKYLKKPEITNPSITSGMTARVAKILSGIPLAGGASAISGPFKPSSEWNDEKSKLEAEIERLNEELKTLKKTGARFTASTTGINAAPRPPAASSELTEVELLRLENYELRNMTDEQRHSKAREIMFGLRRQIEELKSENQTLRSQLAEKQANLFSESSSKPPSDIFAVARPVPLSVDRLDEARINAALEAEWKIAREDSRHGLSAPIQNPFDKRRP